MSLDTNGIKTNDEFIQFVKDLRTEYLSNGDKWENDNLPDFLEALAAWTEDMNKYYKNRGEAPVISWKMFADCLMGATMYE